MTSHITSRPTQPVRWKAWIVTVAGIYPVIVAQVLIITPLTANWPAALRLAVIVPLAVAAMTWIIGPAFQRVLGPWMVRR